MHWRWLQLEQTLRWCRTKQNPIGTQFTVVDRHLDWIEAVLISKITDANVFFVAFLKPKSLIRCMSCCIDFLISILPINFLSHRNFHYNLLTFFCLRHSQFNNNYTKRLPSNIKPFDQYHFEQSNTPKIDKHIKPVFSFFIIL